MKTITIIFVGLIAHVNQPGLSLDDTAVLLRYANHIPQMIVPFGAILNTGDPWVKEQCENEDPCVIELDGYAVRLEDTRGMFCDKSTVTTAVPKLKTIAPSCGSLKQAVRDRTQTAEFVAFVDYDAGSLTVVDYFKKTIRFSIAETAICSACTVRYKGDLHDDDAIFTFTRKGNPKHELRIAGGQAVEVHNRPPDTHSDAQEGAQSHFVDNHWLAYYRLMNDCQGPAPEFLGDCTEMDLCQLPLFPLADCTNSQYP